MSSMVTANAQFFKLLYNHKFELAFHTVIVEYIIHSRICNYTKLACNKFKMIPNDTVSQPIRQEMIGLYNILYVEDGLWARSGSGEAQTVV